jgi:hypothetical protein
LLNLGQSHVSGPFLVESLAAMLAARQAGANGRRKAADEPRKLDRLGRPIKHLIATIEELDRSGIGRKSLAEQLETTTPGCKLIFNLFGALAGFERSPTKKALLAGLSVGRVARGTTASTGSHEARHGQ